MLSLQKIRQALGRLPVANRLALGFGVLVALMFALVCAGLLMMGQDAALAASRRLLGVLGTLAMAVAGVVAWLMVDSLK